MINNLFPMLDMEVISLIIIITISFIGSISKDYVELFRTSHHISFARILLSTVTSSIFIFGFEPVIISYFTFRGLCVISFLGGLVGFELLTRISNISGVMSLINLIFLNRSTDIRDYKDVLDKKDEGKTEVIIVKEKDVKEYKKDKNP